eukprot:1006447-Pelagomonas_calceolata.AAC.1
MHCRQQAVREEGAQEKAHAAVAAAPAWATQSPCLGTPAHPAVALAAWASHSACPGAPDHPAAASAADDPAASGQTAAHRPRYPADVCIPAGGLQMSNQRALTYLALLDLVRGSMEVLAIEVMVLAMVGRAVIFGVLVVASLLGVVAVQGMVTAPEGGGILGIGGAAMIVEIPTQGLKLSGRPQTSSKVRAPQG